MVELIMEFYVIKGREFNLFLNMFGNKILRFVDKMLFVVDFFINWNNIKLL